jgi:hypothetical protein
MVDFPVEGQVNEYAHLPTQTWEVLVNAIAEINSVTAISWPTNKAESPQHAANQVHKIWTQSTMAPTSPFKASKEILHCVGAAYQSIQEYSHTAISHRCPAL